MSKRKFLPAHDCDHAADRLGSALFGAYPVIPITMLAQEPKACICYPHSLCSNTASQAWQPCCSIDIAARAAPKSSHASTCGAASIQELTPFRNTKLAPRQNKHMLLSVSQGVSPLLPFVQNAGTCQVKGEPGLRMRASVRRPWKCSCLLNTQPYAILYPKSLPRM